MKVFWGRVNIENAAAFFFFRKESKVQHLLHKLKYKGMMEVGVQLGRLYGYDLRYASVFKDVQVVIPVPLHKKKLRKRGYNQSEMFAQGLKEVMKIKMEKNCLFRKVDSKTQTRKSRWERWENVRC